jgi:hypothetical protein
MSEAYDPNADFNESEVEVDRAVAAGTELLPPGGIPLTQNGIKPFMPRDTNDLKALVRVIVKGGCVPQTYLLKNSKTPDMAKMAVGILAGREQGWGPITSLQWIMVVNGSPAIWGKGCKAKVSGSGKLVDYRLDWIDGSTLQDVNDEGEVKRLRGEGYMVLWHDGERANWKMAKPMLLPAHNMAVANWPPTLTAHVLAGRRGVRTPYMAKFSVSDAMRARLWGNPKKQPWVLYPQDMLEHKAASRIWDRGFADCLVGIAVYEDSDEHEPEQIAQVDQALLGNAAETQDNAATAERDMLLKGLEGIKDTDGLALWFQASEDRVKWLQGQSEAQAKEVNDAYLAKKAALEAGANPGSEVPQ